MPNSSRSTIPSTLPGSYLVQDPAALVTFRPQATTTPHRRLNPRHTASPFVGALQQMAFLAQRRAASAASKRSARQDAVVPAATPVAASSRAASTSRCPAVGEPWLRVRIGTCGENALGTQRLGFEQPCAAFPNMNCTQSRLLHCALLALIMVRPSTATCVPCQ